MYKISLITDFQQGKPKAQGYEKEREHKGERTSTWHLSRNKVE
jgi:hypothetical protein